MKFAATIACICVSATALIAQSNDTAHQASGAARVDTRVDGIVAKTVSYTHLDVYKRQVRAWSAMARVMAWRIHQVA